MERELTLGQAFRAIGRQRKWVASVALGVFMTGSLWVMSLPKTFSATAVIRVEPQRLGEEMVQRTINDGVEQKLLVVRHELFSRPVLLKAIEEFSLYPDTVKAKGADAALEIMRKALSVRVEGESTFEITYEADSAELAAQVANRLPQLYADEALKVRREQATRATNLFDEELTRLKQQVSRQEAAIAAFKVQHVGELPEQLESNMRGLERMSGLVATKSELLQMAETRRSELVRARYAADTEAGRLKAAEDELTRAQVAASVSWTEEHPERQRINQELVSVAEKRRAAELQMVAEQREREKAAALVEQLKAELVVLEKSASAFQERLDNTPKWAHELGVLHRDYDIARTKYQSLISRQVEAQLAQELEAKAANSLFKVVSVAGIPVAPTKPDRVGGLLLSLLVAILFGVLIGVLIDMRDDSVREPEDIYSLPVLAVVPRFHAEKADQRGVK